MSHWPGLCAPNSNWSEPQPHTYPRASELTHALLQFDLHIMLNPCLLHSASKHIESGPCSKLSVAIVQHAGSSSTTAAPTCFTATVQVPCARPYSPCCYFTPPNRSVFFKKVHLLQALCQMDRLVPQGPPRHRQD